MSASVADVTEIVTGLGMLGPSLHEMLRERPANLVNVPDGTWVSVADAYRAGHRNALFHQAFRNGRFFALADDGLRGRSPLWVEWKGRHRVPGDDAIPADLRVDRVYLVSCKYLSRILVNSGPSRIFGRALRGDERSAIDWFLEVAPDEYQAFYRSVLRSFAVEGLPEEVSQMSRRHREPLREVLRPRRLPERCQEAWSALCAAVADGSAQRWRETMPHQRAQLEVLWRMLRISGSAYFVLGATPAASLRLRVASKWDWLQDFTFRGLRVEPRSAGQPEVAWSAHVRRRSDGTDVSVRGHVEIRWSHGRFNGVPEAKVYLDTPHDLVPGYYAMGDDVDDLTLL